MEFTLKENGDVEWKFPDTQVGIAPYCLKLSQAAPNCLKLLQIIPNWPKLGHKVNCLFVQERLPLFDCDTFEVLREREGFTVVVLLR